VVELSEWVRITAENAGPAGRQWVQQLPRVVEELGRAWSLWIGEVLDGGRWSFVARVGTADGGTAVLKIAIDRAQFARQLATLAAADGRGYVRVYAGDPDRGAALLEPLGPMLATTATSVEQILDVSAAMLRDAWRLPRPAGGQVPPGTDKASTLIESIEGDWAALGRPCPRRIVTHAVELARRRVAAFDLDSCVVVHGDPHPGNALAVLAPRPGAECGYVFIDPDGFLGEPAYDLGVVVRAFTDEVLAAADPVGLVRGWCARLADATGHDPVEIWQWGLVERVSSGLYLMRAGHLEEGRAFLESAGRLIP
jgi:streptomycin 6-kinase